MKKNHKRHKFIMILAAMLIGVFVMLGLFGTNPVNNTANDAKTAPDKLYTDTADKFTLRYPGDWEVTYPQGGKDGPAQPEPDWSEVSRPILIKPAAGHEDNYVTVTPGCTTKSADGRTVAVMQNLLDHNDRFHTQRVVKIHGYTGFYDKLNFKTSAESYLDHTYFVTDYQDCVLFRYRQNMRHDMSNTNYDDSKNMPAYRAIVESITFSGPPPEPR